jgi:putative NIF3 family GTP cyclohydrolase 1 type 2
MVLEQWYDPRRAESWDAVGLVCGDPDDNVGHVLLAVDAVPATVAEAMRVGAELLVSHHPLLLTPVHGVPADDPKGALVHRMIRARIAHYVAHTNADAANPGVSDALGDLLGLANLRPLEPHRFNPDDKLVVFVPLADLVRVVDALAAAGAGRIGNYERCAWSATGIGTFRPEPAATPFTGQVGAVSEVAEARVEMVVPQGLRGDVLQALRAAHPYEEPAFDLYARLPEPAASIGRPGGRAAVTHDVAWIRRSRGARFATDDVGPAGIRPSRSTGPDGRRVRRIRRVTRRGRACRRSGCISHRRPSTSSGRGSGE